MYGAAVPGTAHTQPAVKTWPVPRSVAEAAGLFWKSGRDPDGLFYDLWLERPVTAGRLKLLAASPCAPAAEWATRELGRQVAGIRKAHSTCMVALGVDVAGLPVTDLEPFDAAEDLHLTLAVFSGSQESRVSDATRAVIANAPSLARPPHVTGTGTFATPGGPARVLLVSAPGLEEYRRQVVEALSRDGVAVDTTHGFTPHVTVRYGGAPLPELPKPIPLPLYGRVLATPSGDWVTFKAQRITHKDAAKRLVTVVGYVCRDKANRLVPAEHTDTDGTVVDHSGEMLSIHDLEASMHVFAEGDRDVDRMHENGVGPTPGQSRAKAVEWFVFTPEDKAALKPLGMDPDFPEMVLLKIKVLDDELWREVEAGKLPMLSLAGRFAEVEP